MSKYPTKEEILNNKYNHSQKTIKLVLEWKQKRYNQGKWKEPRLSIPHQIIQIIKLKELIKILTTKNQVKIKIGKTYYYNHKDKTICLDVNNPSIISTLHEIAHHILGASESEACRWSVWLFMECFPEAFKKLKWEKHMLIKQ